MNRRKFSLIAILLISLAMVFAGCSGGGDGGGGGGGGGDTPSVDSATTTISGKVTLSSTVSSTVGKPSYKLKMMAMAPKGKPGTKGYKPGRIPVLSSDPSLKALVAAAADGIPVPDAFVKLYDADHPEWLYPVAKTTTIDDGSYTLSVLSGASSNGNAYTDGDDIPSGIYTTVVSGTNPDTFQPFVYVEATVKDFSGTVTTDNSEETTFVVSKSVDAPPKVKTMFGVSKDTDGTQNWGGTDTVTVRPANAAIQVTFSLEMARPTIQSGITISPDPGGYWAVSADWLSATYYLDTDVTLIPGDTYTVTVNGEDSSASPVRNVYGDPLELTATGTFTVSTAVSSTGEIGVDDMAPTARWLSPTEDEMMDQTMTFDVSKPLQIYANEALDINGLLLESTPSLGARPGVEYIGYNSTTGYYEYSFMLGEELARDTVYTLDVSGGTDLAGNEMIPLPGTLRTASAAEMAGVDETASDAVKDAQTEVKSAFGSWINALNSGSTTQLMATMSPDFVMEYDTSREVWPDDVNRDGKLDVKEFTDMIEGMVTQWEYCGTSLSGDVVGNINYDALTETADFEFNLIETSTSTSQDCMGDGPGSMYVTVANINGDWLVTRTSMDVDTRQRELGSQEVITLLLPADGFALLATPGRTEDGSGNWTAWTDPVEFSWKAPTVEVASYVAVIFSAKDPSRGAAFMLPATMTSISVPDELIDGPTDEINSAFTDVSEEFGFWGEGPDAFMSDGATMKWEIIGLGSTTVGSYKQTGGGNLFGDIVAVSGVNKYLNPGTLLTLDVAISADTTGTGGAKTALTFNEMYWGYDAGAADAATLTITTNDTDVTTVNVEVSGNSWMNYSVTLEEGTGTKEVNLFKGWNHINLWTDGTDEKGLHKEFQVQTTGGEAPVVEITEVVDDISATALTSDGWDYYTANSGATQVTISGTVTTAIANGEVLNVNVWNNSGAHDNYNVTVTGGAFSTTVDVYNGDNWIGIDYSDTTQGFYVGGDHMGLYTDAGTIYIAPITDVDVSGAVRDNDWGDGSEWTHNNTTSATVTITGTFAAGNNGRFDMGSDGGWQEGTLFVDASGNFSLTVELYDGWNWVNLMDCDPNDANSACANWEGDWNWYYVNIYTENGKVVVRPEITAVYDSDGTTALTADQYGEYTASGCSVTVAGTANEGGEGDVEVNWDGYDGTNWYWESQRTQTDSTGAFSVNVNILGGTGSYNNINIYDQNWNWMGATVKTTSTCGYVVPTMSVDTVMDDVGTELTGTLPCSGCSPQYDAGTSPTITISGSSNDEGRKVVARMYTCGGEEIYETTVSGGAWSITGIAVYGSSGGGGTAGGGSYNWIEIEDGYNWQNIEVISSNTNSPTSPLQVDQVGSFTMPEVAGCGYSSWYLTTELTATISVTTTAPAGEGWWNNDSGQGGPLTFTDNGDGTSSADLIDVSLYDGGNWISINDTNWNYHGMDIWTQNGAMRPQAVTITAPVHDTTGGANSVGGTVTVTATVDTSNGFTPTRATAYVSDEVTWDWTDFSSDTYDQQYGWQPLSLSADGTTITFDVNIVAGNPTYISVDACNDTTWECHGHSIYVNNTWGYGEWYMKPGVKSGNDDMKARVQRTRALRSLLKSKALGSNR